MKKILLSVAFTGLFLSSASGTIPPRKSAIEGFMASPEVQARIAAAENAGFEVDKQPQKVVLSGSCGFAGCSSTVLVSLLVRSTGTNPQTSAITAIVLNADGMFEPAVKVVDVEKIIELAN